MREAAEWRDVGHSAVDLSMSMHRSAQFCSIFDEIEFNHYKI